MFAVKLGKKSATALWLKSISWTRDYLTADKFETSDLGQKALNRARPFMPENLYRDARVVTIVSTLAEMNDTECSFK